MKALPALADYGIAGLAILMLGLVVRYMFKLMEAQNSVYLKSVESFQRDIKENNKSRAEDADQVTKAVEHLSSVVLALHRDK